MTERTEAEQQERPLAWDEFTQWLATEEGQRRRANSDNLPLDKDLFEVFAAGWLARSRKP
jgi:hypothetical protein